MHGADSPIQTDGLTITNHVHYRYAISANTKVVVPISTTYKVLLPKPYGRGEGIRTPKLDVISPADFKSDACTVRLLPHIKLKPVAEIIL